MPIDYSLYPPDWKEIRAAVLERAGHKCEVCGVPNHVTGARDKTGNWRDSQYIAGMNGTEGDILFDSKHPKIIRVVLTVAHLNHDVTDNDLGNLKALCQLHHLQHDAKHHARNAARTRRTKREALTGQGVLFAE